jgi:urease accessory protein
MTLIRLLHLCDSLFPTGGFAYSDGLESAAADGLIHGAGQLREWLDTVLEETIGRFEGPAVLHAHDAFGARRWDRLATLDEELTAMRVASAIRRSSAASGRRLLKTWHALYPDARLAHLLAMVDNGRLGPTLPVAFAVACASAGVDARETLEGFAYTRLAATISAAMRLIAIGQHDAHELLARALDRVPGVAAAASGRDVESFAPALDIAQMTHQYVHSRLFRS